MDSLRKDLQLLESELPNRPVDQFRSWFDRAKLEPTPLPEGMSLATVGADGRPSVRVVLLKGLDEEGPRFFTNYASRKGTELGNNPAAALLLWWPTLQRQVRIEGDVRPMDPAESDAYHATRPRGSQIGAWASPQSARVENRDELMLRFADFSDRFSDKPVPRPPHWGGYVLQARRYEFWQGRDNRLHDRIVYERDGDQWRIHRLAP